VVGRPPKFSRQQLQAAALEIVDTQGLSALSMRALAKRLATGPMTLYNHIAGRADLDVLVVDAVMSEVALPHERPDDWRDELESIATAVWTAVRAHPHVVPLILTRRSRSVPVLDVAEALLDALKRSGRTGEDLLGAFRAVSALIAGSVQAQIAGPLATDDDAPALVIDRVRSLPPERYPNLIDIATAAKTSTPASEFHYGLHQLIKGLATPP
jgi:AcrR family transcriptional regulator